MALIKCSGCQAEMSDEAAACPACGSPQVTPVAPAPSSEAQATRPEAEAQPAKARSKAPMLIAVACAGLMALCCLIGTLAPSPPRSTPSQSPGTPEAPPSRPRTQAVSASAERLIEQYEENEVGADQRYKGKVLIVYGCIEAIGKDIRGTVYVSLAANEYDHSDRLVQAYFYDDDHAREVGRLHRGYGLRVIGRCAGLSLGQVRIRDARIHHSDETVDLLDSETGEPTGYSLVNGTLGSAAGPSPTPSPPPPSPPSPTPLPVQAAVTEASKKEDAVPKPAAQPPDEATRRRDLGRALRAWASQDPGIAQLPTVELNQTSVTVTLTGRSAKGDPAAEAVADGWIQAIYGIVAKSDPTSTVRTITVLDGAGGIVKTETRGAAPTPTPATSR